AVALCLSSPNRLVPVGVSGRRASYSESPASFQRRFSRADDKYRCNTALCSLFVILRRIARPTDILESNETRPHGVRYAVCHSVRPCRPHTESAGSAERMMALCISGVAWWRTVMPIRPSRARRANTPQRAGGAHEPTLIVRYAHRLERLDSYWCGSQCCWGAVRPTFLAM